MKQLRRHRLWLWRMTLPLFVLAFFSIAWSVAVNFAMYRSLGVSVTHVDGTPLTLLQEIIWRIPGGVVFVVLLGLIIAIVTFVLMLHFRWWVMLASIAVVGSPIAFVGGRVYAEYSWRLNRGGTPWEEIVPVSVAFAVACFLGFVADAMLDRRQRAMRRQRVAHVLCPKCGYDLRGTIAAGAKRCSECGAPFELVRVEIEGTAHQEIDLTGVAAASPRNSAQEPH